MLEEIKSKWPDVYKPFQGIQHNEELLDQFIMKAAGEMADDQTAIGATVVVRELEAVRAERQLIYRTPSDFAESADLELLRRAYEIAESFRSEVAAL